MLRTALLKCSNGARLAAKKGKSPAKLIHSRFMEDHRTTPTYLSAPQLLYLWQLTYLYQLYQLAACLRQQQIKTFEPVSTEPKPPLGQKSADQGYLKEKSLVTHGCVKENHLPIRRGTSSVPIFANGAATAAFSYLFNEVQGHDDKARKHIRTIRTESTEGAEMVNTLDESDRLYIVRFGIDRNTSGDFIAKGVYDIVINEDNLNQYEVPATDGKWYVETPMRAVAHELGHALMVEKHGSYWAKNRYFDMATTIENSVSRQINPKAWQRIGHGYRLPK